jgi:hypothetical protein
MKKSKSNFTPLEPENIFILERGGVKLLLDDFSNLQKSDDSTLIYRHMEMKSKIEFTPLEPENIFILRRQV